MSFPQTAAPTVTLFTTVTTGHAVLMPPVISAGELLLVAFAQISAAVTTPADWNLLLHSITDVALDTYYKVAVGNEDGTTVDFVTSVTRRAAAQVYRITDWHGTTPPEAAGTSGTSVNPDSPLLVPSWGAADTLWFSMMDHSGGNGTISDYPDDYLNGVQSTGASIPTLGSARREVNAASQNPNSFTVGVSASWVAQTIAIRPAFPAVDDTGTRAVLRHPTSNLSR